ncbi:MAG: hypothetical protein RLN70_06055, partial [Rhodospirillaceae bacterium]
NLEHLVTAKRIETLGAARVLNNPAKELPGKALTQFFIRAARDEALLETAIGAAKSVELGSPEAGLKVIVDACFELVGKSPA